MAGRNPETRKAAAELFARGVSRSEAARRLGVSRATTSRWFRRWQQGGAAALTSPAPRGRPPRLQPSDLDQFQKSLAAPPRESGFPLDRWSLHAIVALIHRRTGIAYHPRHVARVLHRAGWVIPPVGKHAHHAFRQLEHRDPDGNPLLFRFSTMRQR